MHIWIINHYSYPPTFSGATRHYNLARQLVEQGHEVTLVASSFHHHEKGELLLEPGENFRHEIYNGVRFVWIRGLPYHSNDGIRRILNMLHFGWKVFRKTGLKELPRPDVIMGCSVHLFTPLGAYGLAKRLGTPFVLEIRDLWPQTLIDIGKINRWHPFIILLSLIERFLYRVSDKIVTALPSSEAHIIGKGGRAEDILCIPNFIDLMQMPDPTPSAEKSVFTVMYAGSHGLANDLLYTLQAAKLLLDDGWGDRVRFYFIGDGPEKPNLQKYAHEAGLTNVIFEAPVPKKDIYRVLETADVFIITSIKTDLYRWGFSPNKLFDYLGMSRPIIYGVHSPYNPIEQAQAGITVPAEDAQAIAEAVQTLAEMSPQDRHEIGLRGRRYVEEHHDARKLAQKLEELFLEVCLHQQST